MAKFTESVRSGGTKAPQQRGFKLSNWNESYEKLNTGDSEDRELFEAGAWFSGEFDQVRKITEEGLSTFHWSTQRDRLLAIVGYATREWRVLGNYVWEQIKKTPEIGYFPSELDKVSVKSPFFDKVDPTASIEILVDGLRYPLSVDFGKSATTVVRGKGTAADLAAIVRLVFTGQHYHTLEEIWLDCVWNGFHVDNSGDVTVIKHRDATMRWREVVSAFRRQSLGFEATQRAAMIWQHKMSEQDKKDFLSRRKVLSVYKRNGKFRVKTADAIRFEHRPSSIPILQMMLTPPHAERLLERRIGGFHNLTLLQIVTAYDLVSQIPHQVAAFLPKDGGVERPEDLLGWPPVFSRNELVKALVVALQANVSQVEWLLELMTHPKSVREQLWFRPFINLGDDELTIVLAAVDGVNFARLFDWLLARDAQVEQQLGSLFEEFVYSKVKAAFLESSIRNTLELARRPSTLVRLEKATEEIDLAFLIGRRLFICELKSTQYPTEPLEHFTYRNRLSDAAHQASRKVAFVKANLASSAEQLGIKLNEPLATIEVHPLIVTSSPLFAGWSWDGVAVSDWFIIRRFFVEGKLELLGYHNTDGDLVHTLTQPFYKSAAEAEQVIVDYFAHAPQVRLFEGFLEVSHHPLPVFGKSDKRKVIRSFAVQLPHDTLRKIMETKVTS